MARVFVVDDSDSIRRLYRVVLTAEGHDVVESTNGLEALEKLRSEVFDVMILDHSMPEMSGIEVLQFCRGIELPSRPAVIMITAHRSADLALRARELGAREVLVKSSFSNDELARYVRGLCR